jgi:hypothetical protein
MIPQSPLRLVKAAEEFIAADDIDKVPKGLRGIYILYNQRPERNRVWSWGHPLEGQVKRRRYSVRNKLNFISSGSTRLVGDL